MADLELIKKVREITGAGMVDVSKALQEANDDEAKAIEILRKSGQKIADKKSAREMKEGVLALAVAADKIAVVKLTCETDFVARNQDFIDTVQSLADKLLTLGKAEFTAWAENEIKNNLIVKIGENIQLGQAEIVDGQIIGTYLHPNRKVIGVAVLSAGQAEVAKEVAMQVAAMAPKYLRPEDVPAEVVAKEKEIYAEQLKAENKPAEMLEKILQGKLQKLYTEICLLKQAYIKDDKISMEKYLADNQAQLAKFYYFSLN